MKISTHQQLLNSNVFKWRSPPVLLWQTASRISLKERSLFAGKWWSSWAHNLPALFSFLIVFPFNFFISGSYLFLLSQEVLLLLFIHHHLHHLLLLHHLLYRPFLLHYHTTPPHPNPLIGWIPPLLSVHPDGMCSQKDKKYKSNPNSPLFSTCIIELDSRNEVKKRSRMWIVRTAMDQVGWFFYK